MVHPTRRKFKRNIHDMTLAELMQLEGIRTGHPPDELFESALSVIEHGTSVEQMRWNLMKNLSEWRRNEYGN